MIKSVGLQNFKCFSKRKDINLAKITILYGHNGRGKSSLSQALLLLGQTMKKRNDLDQLMIVGEQVDLVSFTDIKTVGSELDEVRFWIETEKEQVEMGFSAFVDKPQLGRLSALLFNNQNRFEEQTTLSADNADGVGKVAYSTSDISVLQQLKGISYISAGRFGPVNDSLRNDSLPSNSVGTKGENLLNALSHQTPEFVEYVGRCLSKILKGAAIKIPDSSATRLELLLNSKDGEQFFRPVNVGFGYSYVLPVIVGTLLAEEGSIVIVENPEAHLHPGAQSRIMEFLIEQSLKKDLQLIIETHSDHVVNGMRISMKKGVLKPTDSIVQHFAYLDVQDAPVITPITCDAYGNMSDYPEDFQDEWTAQMLELV
jgi:predicted ATPase